jgi:(1->4)-alpha-D-glucan 1-alpha-D-glucosylmutase
VKIISPGIPDFYQGSELWDLRLVDPDNRQPVDFAKRVSMLEALQRPSESIGSHASDLAGHWEDGGIKLYTIWKALTLRRERPELFSKGAFVELKATGPSAEHVLAILRHFKREWVLLVAPRWPSRGGDEIRWRETAVPLPDSAPSSWESIFTGSKITTGDERPKSFRVDQLLKHFPLALLSSGKPPAANH